MKDSAGNLATGINVLIQVLLADTTEELLKAYRAASVFSDLVELRLDRTRDLDLAALFDATGKPRIATCRSRAQGGFFPGTESQRQGILEEAIRRGAEYVDLEFESDDEELLGCTGKSQAVLSYHHRGGTPVDLEAIYRRMAERGDDVILKLIPFADSCTDNLRIRALLEQARDEGRRLIAFCMGEKGKMSRVLSRAWQSWAVYAPSDYDSQTAPGQLLLQDLVEVFRYQDLDAGTSLFGILGHPVSNSLSPLLHNQAYREMGMPHRFIPFESEAVSEFLPLLTELPLLGLAVTHPHKEAMLSHCDELSETARRVGAVNTVLKRWNRLVGHNTDVEGGVAPLKRRISLKGARVGILGAGGAARALAYGLGQEGADVILHARKEANAAKVANELGCGYATWSHAETFQGTVLINATPAATSSAHLSWEKRRVDLAYDLIYHPGNTRFLKEARNAGVETVSGMDMFLEQALLQFELMTRRPPSRELFEKILLPFRSGETGGER